MYKYIEINSHQRKYSAVFQNSLDEMTESLHEKNPFFIIDKKIMELHGKWIFKGELPPRSLLIDACEDSKSFSQIEAYLKILLNHGVFRKDILVAIGGGIIQDITCFLASVFLRGIEWIFVPTTLLAQADSCIGSKSSINVGNVKNIIGTYFPPSKIYINSKFIKTLSPLDIYSGLGEMIKIHIIKGPEQFKEFEKNYDAILQNLLLSSKTMGCAGEDREAIAGDEITQSFIYKSLLYKKEIIEVDEYDKGIRNIMNYGHTFGHAIEAASEYRIPHGVAVTIGMDLANYFSVRSGYSSRKHYERMRDLLERNYACCYGETIDFEKFILAIQKDKKNQGKNELGLILLNQDAQPFKVICKRDVLFDECCQEFFTLKNLLRSKKGG